MRVWLVSIGERPASSTTLPLYAGRMDILARQLLRKGADVTWWSTTFDHRTKKHLAPLGSRYQIQQRLEVILTSAPGYRRNISPRRLIFNWLSARRFRKLCESEPRPDVILASYPTIEMISAIADYAQHRAIPVVADIRDLWPEIWLEAVPPSFRFAARGLLSGYFHTSHKALASMTAITGITEEFVSWGIQRAGRQRTHRDRSFPFGYELPNLSPDEAEKAADFWNDHLQCRTYQPRVRLVFIGSIGVRTGIDHVIRAILELPSQIRTQLQLVICGANLDGQVNNAFDSLRERIGADPSVIFAGWVDKPKLLALMKMSDLGIVPYPNTLDSQNSLSNKAIEYLAGGLAILTGLDGKLKQLILNTKCGFTYSNQDIGSLQRRLIEILEDPHTLELRKLAAHKTYQEQFQGNVVYSAFADHVLDLALHKNSQP